MASLGIVTTKAGRRVCNECFNKLSIEERGGCGAGPVGWSPPDTPTVDCEICGRPALDMGEPEKEGG